MKFNKKEMFTIPNILTYIRMLCVPFFIWLMLDKSISNNIMIAFGIFLFATMTDFADGFIARRFNQVSDIGKVLDPIGDKFLQVSTLICLTINAQIHWAITMIYLLKELYMVLGGAVILKVMKSDYEIQANYFGKIATIINSLGIVLAFFVGMVNNAYNIAVTVILSLGVVFAIITAGAYTIDFLKYRKQELIGKIDSKEHFDEVDDEHNDDSKSQEDK